MRSSKSPNLETPHQLQTPRSSRDRGHHHPRGSGVTLTCRTRVLRVTRSMGLYSSAEGRDKVSAATRAWSPGTSPTHHREHRGKEGSPDAQGKHLRSVLHSWTMVVVPGAGGSQHCHSPVSCCAGGTRSHSQAGVRSWEVGTGCPTTPVAAQGWDSPLEGRASPGGLHPHLLCGG